MRRTVLAFLLSTTAVTIAQPAAAQSNVFDLGTITVTSGQNDNLGNSSVSPTGVSISNEQIYVQNATTLDSALANLPGVSATMDSNGRRNERDIFVRGFGRWQVPLTIDGVRIYLPADNRLDFNRFPTSDLSEIQVEKGYASVLNGPGGLGGWINLVTRKPVKPFEAEAIAGFTIDNRGSFQGWQTYGRVGTLQERYYLQASFTSNDQDFWTLSRKYSPTPTSLEDGGRRINSDSGDWRLNLKAGFTPNDTDEYVFNYVRQEGFKGGPLHVRTNPPVPANGFWRWPQWDVSTFSFLSNTKIGDASYIKTKFYYNTFDNLLSAYDNISYTTQSNNGRFDSYYNDNAYGASIEAGTQITPRNLLKAAFHIRYDTHKEYNDNRPTHPTLRNIEPTQTQKERTWSIAAENTFRVTQDIDWIAGISYDENKLLLAEEYNSGTMTIFNYPLGGSNAFNWQSMLVWRYSPQGQFHASVSSRSRFPTLFERFSTRFGTALPNPDLGPERSINYELGWKYRPNPDTRIETAVCYSDVTDFIQTVTVVPGTTQFQNVGNGHFYGFEISGVTRLHSQLTAGANYTFIRREITDVVNTAFRPTGVPQHKAYLYLSYTPTEKLEIIPSVELASARWTDVTLQPAPILPPGVGVYSLTGSYTLVNLTARYKVTKNLELTAGVRNLLDKNYELADGLPEPGRTVFAKARATF